MQLAHMIAQHNSEYAARAHPRTRHKKKHTNRSGASSPWNVICTSKFKGTRCALSHAHASTGADNPRILPVGIRTKGEGQTTTHRQLTDDVAGRDVYLGGNALQQSEVLLEDAVVHLRHSQRLGLGPDPIAVALGLVALDAARTTRSEGGKKYYENLS